MTTAKVRDDVHDPPAAHHERPRDRHALHAQLRHEVHHYAHMLSEQGPMNITFVHNNTLLGLQGRHFEAAILEAQRVLGARGYEPVARFREYHARGRITERDLERALDEREALRLDAELARTGDQIIRRREVLRAALLHDLRGIEPAALCYAAEQQQALARLAAELPAPTRESLIANARESLQAAVASVGRDRLLSDWVGGLLGLDLRAALRQSLRDLAEHGLPEHAPAAVDSLRRLGIADAHHGAYLGLIDAALAGVRNLADMAPDLLRAAALEQEHLLLDAICQRHWACAGSLDALAARLRQDIEGHTASALWAAVLSVLDLEDPCSPTDPGTLQTRDLSLDQAETEQLRLAGSAGRALPTLVAGGLRRRILALLDTAAPTTDPASLSHLEEQLEDGALDAADVEQVAALAAAAGGADHAALIVALRAEDPVRRREAYVAALLAGDRAWLRQGRTHADWLHELTGTDLGEDVNHYMIRVCSAFLDEGLAAWRMPDRALGFFAGWRASAARDLGLQLEGLTDWAEELERLPADPADAVIALLDRLGVDHADWGEYLGRSLARLKGWAGMVYWYELHPKHYKQAVQPIDTVQYLAVRLFYEAMLVRRCCEQLWGLDGQADRLLRYFEIHADEYLVRRELHAGRLSDTLADLARRELAAMTRGRRPPLAIRALADAVWLHRLSMAPRVRAGADAWRLYRLGQHLGLTAGNIETLGPAGARALLEALDACTEDAMAPIWLRAFECHYRDEVLNALAQNRGRGRWAKGRGRRPRSQLVLCIDEREENLHRHYGELDPDHETLGAAGFFGVAQSFIALDDHLPTPLCPAVATPAHQILEIPRNDARHTSFPLHQRRFKWKAVFDGAYWETKRNVAGSFFLIELAGFLMALPLLGRIFAPRWYARTAGEIGDAIIPPVQTRLTHIRMDEAEARKLGLHTQGLPLGFAVPEAADRVEAQLRNWGLTYQFARIVVICAHRSFSVNNPHENAHDCGACGGKAGGPNSRLFAALANDPRVREELRRRGIEIPDDSWFVGAEHNTCSDEILSFDTEDLPTSLRADWQLVSADLLEAKRRAARERCRRFGSAPKDASLEASLRHVEGRSNDLSQVRPEWGHATNAFALVGRRCLTQGLFFDRRGFIISYDPTQDPDGKIVERILLAVGPVGAGINLEYYFSTVDPDNFGCGTKVPHNVTGMIGVMAGAHGDLQTGLPRQMTEVHEAMRLQLIVDAKMSVLGEIYGRQPGIRQLLDGQWVHLIAHDPETGELNLFVPGKGFVKWDQPLTPLPEVAESYDWFRGKHERFLPPCRVAEPARRWTETARTQ